MSSPRISNTNSKQRKHFPIERRPRMLKDFLIDDSNSFSSSGFLSFPRTAQDSSIRNLIQTDLNMAPSYSSNTKRLLRSRSKAAASTTISAFQAIINTVKSIQFNMVKSTSILPRSLSRKLSRKNSNKSENKESDVKITVRVKDIIRWKSFRDLIEENPQPLDLASSPDHHCTTTTTTTTTTTGSTNSTPCSSNGSSWCESDFTSEYLPSWRGNSQGYTEHDAVSGKQYSPCVGTDSMKATTEAAAALNTGVGPKELAREEKEQGSPVSVLDFELEQEDEDSPLSFDQTLANMEKTNRKLLLKIRHFESVAKIDPINLDKWMSMEKSDDGYGDDEEEEEEEEEEDEDEEKEILLLHHVKATSPMWSYKNNNVVEQLLLDFFADELSTNRNHRSKIDDIEGKILKRAISWIKGEHGATLIDREACVRDMDRKESWGKFEDEQEVVALQIENVLLNVLVDEALADLISSEQ